MFDKSEYEKAKDIPDVMRDERWRTPEKIAKITGADVRLVRGILYWLVGGKDNWKKKYTAVSGNVHGGGNCQVYFKRKTPEQRSLADFI